jgi:hypothetical protein
VWCAKPGLARGLLGFGRLRGRVIHSTGLACSFPGFFQFLLFGAGISLRVGGLSFHQVKMGGEIDLVEEAFAVFAFFFAVIVDAVFGKGSFEFIHAGTNFVEYFLGDFSFAWFFAAFLGFSKQFGEYFRCCFLDECFSGGVTGFFCRRGHIDSGKQANGKCGVQYFVHGFFRWVDEIPAGGLYTQRQGSECQG